MLFEEDVPEDKGLFTFYREQADKEEEIKREKKQRRKKKQHQDNKKEKIQKQIPVGKLMPIVKLSPPAKPFVFIEPNLKPKLNLPKQRLIQSVVDMGKQIKEQEETANEKPSFNYLKIRQPSFISKTRKYQQKVMEMKYQKDYDSPDYEDDSKISKQMLIESLQRRNQSQQHISSKFKQVIHSARDSVVALPQIRKSDELKVPYRPKKSIKSKMIQDALHTKDKNKIRQIRQYMKITSPKQEEKGDYEQVQFDFEVDQKSFQIFEQRQQKLMGILRRFRKGN